MKEQIYDVAVAYRIYPKISKNPIVFKNDKYKLAHLCLKSFKQSLGRLNAKIWVILDNCPKKFEDLFRTYFNDENLEFIRLPGLGNQFTFNLQIKILLEQNASNIIYFAEDDYYYFPNQFEKMVDFLKKDSEVHFITPYDHLDHYTHSFHTYLSKIKTFSGKHWRTISSTCLTFITTKRTLAQTKNVFEKYCNVKNFFSKKVFLKKSKLSRFFSDFIKGSRDPDIWLSLTKNNIANLFKIIKHRFNNREAFRIFLRAWRFNWKQILFGKRWILWCPIPSISTHMEENLLAPSIDWKTIFKKEIEKLNYK